MKSPNLQPYCRWWRHCMTGCDCESALTDGVIMRHHQDHKPILEHTRVPDCFLPCSDDEVAKDIAASAERLKQSECAR